MAVSTDKQSFWNHLDVLRTAIVKYLLEVKSNPNSKFYSLCRILLNIKISVSKNNVIFALEISVLLI